MAAFASTDVSVTIHARDRDIGHGSIMKNVSLASITFGDGALTYATGGVPLPAKEQFGFQKEIKFLAIQQPVANGFIYKYDADNHKIKIFTQGFTTGSTAAASNENGALVEDSAGSEGTPRIPNTAADTTYDMGPMIELPNGIAPAEVTLPLLMIGE